MYPTKQAINTFIQLPVHPPSIQLFIHPLKQEWRPVNLIRFRGEFCGSSIPGKATKYATRGVQVARLIYWHGYDIKGWVRPSSNDSVEMTHQLKAVPLRHILVIHERLFDSIVPFTASLRCLCVIVVLLLCFRLRKCYWRRWKIVNEWFYAALCLET